MSERQKVILKYIKTAAIIFGVIFAVKGLQNESAAVRRSQIDKTGEMIAAFGSPELIAGARAMLTVQSLEPNEDNHLKMLSDFSPLRQHLINWAACIEFELCGPQIAMELFCRRLLAYEYAFSRAESHFGFTYDEEARDWHYFDGIKKCKLRFPEIASRLTAT